ncbi:hypothetical protein [Streptomyces sp. NPDC006285]|uniref:hypothetical protein n=1 Tax=Streptomyces sp. NPDC006285 TaxID=3364742 RepID=UPI003697A7C3
MLWVRDEALVLHAMRWPDEIRSPAELAPKAVDVSDHEIEGATGPHGTDGPRRPGG